MKFNDELIERIRGEKGVDSRKRTLPADKFRWPVREELPSDLAVEDAMMSIDLGDVDWDAMVWWNEQLASASWKAWKESKPPLKYLKMQVTEDLLANMLARFPRSEKRLTDYLENAIGHLCRSVEDVAGRPFIVYDPLTGIWRGEGEWINETQVGTTVGAVVDQLLTEMDAAMNRCVDLLMAVGTKLYPQPDMPDGLAPAAEWAAYAREMKRWKSDMAGPLEAKDFARSLSRGQMSKVKSQFRERMATKQTKWDALTRYIVLKDGVVDVADVLEKGRVELGPFSPLHWSTMALDVGWGSQRNAGKTEWERGIEKVVPEEDVRRYLQKRYGAALLGTPGIAGKSLVWQYGPGDTAKSTIQECVAGAKGVFAAYAMTTTADVLTKEGLRTGAAERFKAYARGKRFVIASELPDGQMLAQDTVKTITGGETVSGTAKYSNSVEYFFTATVFMSSNHPPSFPYGDTALVGRVHVVPFQHRLWVRSKNPVEWDHATEAHRADEQWKERLLENGQERSAILRWVLDGLAAFGRDGGLGELPTAMTEAREEFASEADPVGTLVRTMLGEEPGNEHLARIRVWTDDEWEAAAMMDGQGILKPEIETIIDETAAALGMVPPFETLGSKIRLAARRMLNEKGGTWKKVRVPGTRTTQYGMSRCTSFRVVSPAD